jgi:hypothetical protein
MDININGEQMGMNLIGEQMDININGEQMGMNLIGEHQ